MAPQIQTSQTPIPVDPGPHPIPVDPLPVLPPQPTLTPVTTPTMVLFLTTLAASKAAGVAAIRLSLLNNGGHQVEELNAKGERIVGFVLYAVGNAGAKKATGVAVLQMGSGNALLPFTSAQRSACGLMRDEITQYRATLAAPLPAGTKVMAESAGRSWLEVALIYADCAAAIAEGGANPLANVVCVGGVAAGNWAIYDTDDDPTDDPTETVPVIDIPPDPEPIGPITSSAPDDPPPPPPDGGGSGGDSGGGGGNGGGGDVGPGDDNGSTHEED